MKTLEYIKNNYESSTLDGRDVNRLANFLSEEDFPLFKLTLKDESKGTHVPEEFTRENVLKHLESDLASAFEKALNKRGISSSLMFSVIMMWNWILEEGLEDFDEDNYALYGLPLFKATAVKYGFDNPIGYDNGDESIYSG